MKPHDAWLEKAVGDLNSARKLLAGNDPIFDTSAYHTQQCAEKALKGFLAYHNKPAFKTHDLTELIDYCVELDSDFASMYDMVEQINPYSTIFRYPGEFSQPEYIDVEIAIEYAEKILFFVKDRI